MNEVEILKENYDRMSYLEKSQYLSNLAGYINMQLKTVVNENDAYDFIKENIDELVNILSIYKNDIELSKYIHRNIAEVMEIAPMILTYDVRLSMLITILNELESDIIKELPENIKLAKLFNKIAGNSEKIASIIGVTSSDFNNIIQKMGEHTDEIAKTIEFSKIFK